jgi:hypothetical protein
MFDFRTHFQLQFRPGTWAFWLFSSFLGLLQLCSWQRCGTQGGGGVAFGGRVGGGGAAVANG